VEEVVDGIVAAQEHKRAHVFENPVFRPQEDIVRGVAPVRRTRVLEKRSGFPRSWYAEAHCKLATIDVTWQLKRVAMNFFIDYNRRKEHYDMIGKQEALYKMQAEDLEAAPEQAQPHIIEFKCTRRFQDMWANLSAADKAMWIVAAHEGRSLMNPELCGPSTEGVADRQSTRAALATFHGDWGFHLPEVQALMRMARLRGALVSMLAQPTLGESFVVTGVGLIGLLTVQLLRAQGCRVLAIDFDEAKLAQARQFGAATCNPGQGEDPVAAGMALSCGQGVDGVIITASTKSSDPVTQAA
jgi:hypothetical protein